MVSVSTVYGQVGINTSNPQGKFHVDGGKDNPATGLPTSTQVSNDIVVIENGNVGSGTLVPSTKFEINNGTSNGALKIVDGTQANGRILVSDENGVGKWQLPNTIKKVKVGTFTNKGQLVVSDGGGYKYSNVSITLTKGVWVVNMGLTLKSYIEKAKGKWVHFKLSSSTTGVDNTGWVNLGTAGNNTSFAGAVFGSAVYNSNSSSGITTVYFDANGINFIYGSNIIEVTADTLALHLLIENFPDYAKPYPNAVHFYGLTDELPLMGKVWVFDTGNWENYFYANPL